jgi:hypothetical protein
MKNTPRQYSLVKIEPKHKKWLEENASDTILLKEKTFVFLGEIPNMPEHCIIAGQESGKIYSGYDIENFVELSSEEV